MLFTFEIKIINWTNELSFEIGNLLKFHFLQLFTLWSWLPARITMYTPTLLYTTEEHGCSLTTFYVRVEQHEPTLLMIKTCNNEVSYFRIKTYYCNGKTFALIINSFIILNYRYLVLIAQLVGMNVI